MFTLIELTSGECNLFSIGLSVLADCIMLGSLWWAHKSPKS